MHRTLKVLSLALFTLSICLATARVTKAQAHDATWPGESEKVEICVFNPTTKVGLRRIPVSPLVAKVLRSRDNFLMVEPQENCDTEYDDNCDGQVNEGCPRCGDGTLDEGEECDLGEANGQPDGTCSTACKMAPAPDAQFAFRDIGGEDCTRCMDTRCTEQVAKCGNSSECVELSECPATQACLSSKFGSHSCICGDRAAPASCRSWPFPRLKSEFTGACSDELIPKIGRDKVATPGWFNSERTPVADSTHMYFCMFLSCQEQCHEVFSDLNPVCGNGIVEVGEECDDQNQVDTDECSNTCKFSEADRFKEIEHLRVTGPACNKCMRASCRSELLKCLDDPNCIQISKCSVQEQCIDSFLGVLPCVCGNLQVRECGELQGNLEDKPSAGVEALPGACAAEIAELTGVKTVRELIRSMGDHSRGVGASSRMTTCMGRLCKSECGEIIHEIFP